MINTPRQNTPTGSPMESPMMLPDMELLSATLFNAIPELEGVADDVDDVDDVDKADDRAAEVIAERADEAGEPLDVTASKTVCVDRSASVAVFEADWPVCSDSETVEVLAFACISSIEVVIVETVV